MEELRPMCLGAAALRVSPLNPDRGKGNAAPRRLRVSFVRVESSVDPVALRDARLRMGLTQHELARLIDVAGGERISRWELGSSTPRPEMLQRLAQALNVGVAELLEAGGPVDLRRLRASAGLSARALAARAHISVPTYVRWESGRTKRLPGSQVLKPLAKALNVTVEDVESAIVTARAEPDRRTDPKKRTTP
jgi:transcriptional regulator with XRE-family HTH domain